MNETNTPLLDEKKANIHWLDWNHPVLPQATQWLIDSYRKGDVLDLSDVIVVLPGAKAVARLTELLVHQSEQQGLFLTPPDIITTGKLPEKLYRSKRRFASDIEQLFGWVRALQSMPRDELAPLIGQREDFSKWSDWLPLVKSLIALHRELSSEVFTFRQVLKRVNEIPGFPEIERWETLAKIQRHYFDLLESYELWDRQTARTVAVFNKECETDKRIVLIGTVDLNQSTRRMVELVQQKVDVLIAGDPSMADKFDDCGCLVAAGWLDEKINVDHSKIKTAENPAEQAELVIDWLAELNGRYPINEIQVGVPDSQVTPFVARALEENEIESIDLSGESTALSRPVTLLKILGEYLQSQRWDAFAELVRHPDVYRMISSQVKNSVWLEQVDKYQNKALPARLPINNLPKPVVQSSIYSVCVVIQNWLSPILANETNAAENCKRIREVLLNVYGELKLDRRLEPNRKLLAAVSKLQSAILELESAAGLDDLEVDPALTIRIIYDSVSGESYIKRSDPNSLELAGWLELPLSDANAICVTGMNDGVVPSVESANVFLPNSLRSFLGLMDNSRRFARDAYAIQVINRCRDDIQFIMGRRDVENSPLLPSRLLMSCDPNELPTRALDFFNYKSTRPPRFWLNKADRFADRQSLAIPEPTEKWLIDQSFSVTDFKKYMACPYRFYLSRVLKLKSVDDRGFELEASEFGNLFHDLVESFGRSNAKDSNDKKEIEEYLLDELAKMSRERFDVQRQVSVSIQLKHLERRLKAFAVAQADWRKQGWKIQEVESTSYQAKIDVDGIDAIIHGRIDRIDANEDDQRLAVLDYKAFENHKSPNETHVKRNRRVKQNEYVPVEKDEWVDLQLPLYYHLIAQSKFKADDRSKIVVGYFVVPGEVDKTGVVKADWREECLDNAFERAREIISDIRNQRFWPPIEPPPLYDDFEAICQTNALEQWTKQDEQNQ